MKYANLPERQWTKKLWVWGLSTSSTGSYPWQGASSKVWIQNTTVRVVWSQPLEYMLSFFNKGSRVDWAWIPACWYPHPFELLGKLWNSKDNFCYWGWNRLTKHKVCIVNCAFCFFITLLYGLWHPAIRKLRFILSKECACWWLDNIMNPPHPLPNSLTFSLGSVWCLFYTCVYTHTHTHTHTHTYTHTHIYIYILFPSVLLLQDWEF